MPSYLAHHRISKDVISFLRLQRRFAVRSLSSLFLSDGGIQNSQNGLSNDVNSKPQRDEIQVEHLRILR